MNNKLNIKLISVAFIFLFSSVGFPQGDINVVISNASVNQAVQALLDTHAYNFARWDGSYGVGDYHVGINTASVNLIGNGTNYVELSVNLIGMANFNIVLANWDQSVYASGIVYGNISLSSQENGYKIIFNPQGVKNFNVTSTFLDDIIQNALLSQLPEMQLGSYTSLFPGVLAQYVKSTIPAITINNNNIVLSLSMNSMTTTGTLQYNETWYGAVNLTGNVIVPSGITLNILPGTTITIPNGVSLTSNGTLTANGSSSPITFNLSGTGGINISGTTSNNSLLDCVTINNGAGVTFSNGSTASIYGSTLNNCTQGIYIYNAAPYIIANNIINPSQNGIYIDAPYSQPNINGNLIKSTTGSSNVGIDVADNSIPWISSNKIGGFNYGIYTGGSSVAQLMLPGFGNPIQNNLIYGNYDGVTAAWGGEVLGAYSNGNGSNNSIHGNTNNDLYSYQSGILYADFDYLGSSPKIYNNGGAIYYTNTLGNDPWGNATPSIKQKNNSPKGNVIESFIIPNPIVSDSSSTDLFTAFNLESKGNLSGAIIQYMSMLTKDSYADLAITELFKLFKQYARTDILNYFNIFPPTNKHYPLVSKLIADNNLQTGVFDKARFQKLFAYLNIKNDKTTAQQILSEIKTLNLSTKDPQWTTQIQMAESILGNSNIALDKSQADKASKNIESENTPTEYALSNNYPNPFNPTTIIEYQLPKNGFVSLKVYDILGRVVRTLVNENKTVGKYSVNFDASKLASGIYFYQLKSNGFSSIKKMILTK
jgi:hypothetical protein